MITWFYGRHPKSEKPKKSPLDEFFGKSGIEGRADALARESNQNILDAAIDKNAGAFVRFSFGTTDFEAAGLDVGLWKHVQEADKANELEDLDPKQCRYMNVEDFRTTGLRGDPKNPWPFDENNSLAKDEQFFAFLRAEGHSTKDGNDRGSWGLGKHTFLAASRARLMFVYTVREETPERGGNGPLVMGVNVLPETHKVDGSLFSPDGWWGDLVVDEEDGEEMVFPFGPETQYPSMIKDTFNLIREDEQTGLSVVVPFLHDELTAEKLLQTIVRNYAIAISDGELTVEIVAEDGQIFTLSAENIVDTLREHNLHDELEELQLFLWGKQNRNDAFTLAKPALGVKPQWTQDSPPFMDETQASAIREKIKDGNVAVRVEVPVIYAKSNKIVWSHFYCLFAPTQSNSKPSFYRGGLKISDVRSSSPTGIRTLVIIEDETLSEFLRDAEDPGHTNWDSKKYQGRYEYGASYISFIKNAPAEIFRLARSHEIDEDTEAAIDYFFVTLPEAGKSPKKKKGKRGKGEVVTETEFPSQPSWFKVHKIVNNDESGFTCSVDADLVKTAAQIELEIAYNVSRGNPFKQYKVYDFRIEDHCKINKEGVSNMETDRNVIKASFEDPETFHLKVTGFDPNRDLIINPRIRRNSNG